MLNNQMLKRHIIVSSILLFTFLFASAVDVEAMTSQHSAMMTYSKSKIAGNASVIDIAGYDLIKDSNDYNEMYDQLYYQTPEAFNLKTLGVRYYPSNNQVISLTPEYKMSNATYKSRLAKAKKKRKKFSGNQAQKACKIHKYLIKMISYKRSKRGLDTALVDKKTNCMGYSAAFQWLCRYNGLQCITVNDAKETHMWNKVKIGSRWYNVDVTNDDYGKKVSTRYLLVKDSKMPKHHSKYKARKSYSAKKVKKYSK